MSGVHAQPRTTHAILDLCAFTGLAEAEVRARIARGIVGTAEAFNAFEGAPEQFYEESTAYLYELTAYEDDPLRAALAERIGHALPGASLLEFGCGIGTQAILFTEAGLEVTACDVNRHNRAFLNYRAQRHPWGARLRVVSPAESLAGGTHYTVVSCQHVLEHVDTPLAYLRRFHARIEPGGLFLGIAPFDLVGPDFPEHRVEHQDLRLENLCAEAGFAIVQVVEFGGYLGRPFWLVIAQKPA
jgi:SAM-dependent methyltransferase